jgi:CTP:molybdopterin cytidylyltransferase MocA
MKNSSFRNAVKSISGIILASGLSKIVDNNAPQLGQSNSVRLGVENSCQLADGFMFLVGDQPFITESIINDLLESLYQVTVVQWFHYIMGQEEIL